MSRLARPAWHEAYDAQVALWRWYRQERSARWLAGIFRALVDGVPPSARKHLAHMFDAEMGKLIDCDPIYVSAEMCELVDYARESFQPEPLHDFDLPTPRGFLYYARPFAIFDKVGNRLEVRAISWHQEHVATSDEPGFVEALAERVADGEFAHGDRLRTSETDALVAEGWIEAVGIEITLYCDTGPYLEVSALRGANESDYEYAKTMEASKILTDGVPIVPIHLAPWNYEMEFAGNEIDVLGMPTGAGQWWRLAQTTFRLMMQKRPRATYGRPDRPVRREAARLGFPPETEVVIVRLRREESPRPDEVEPSGRTLSYRHIRGGHWRNQWYPSAQVHRQIYIFPTVVGDESLPLIVRPRRVFQWTR